MMNIHARREEILGIVRQQAIHSQDELLAILRKRGFRVTQPTLSRDIRELGLAKTPAGYVIPGDLASVTPIAAFTAREVREERLEHLLRESIVFAEAAGNLVVLKTPPAAAQPVASALDSNPPRDALGTVGGDDTIFVAFRHPASANAFAHYVQQTAELARRVRA
ncbi:MAG TPA: arginine repressor [Thermoanaerobaculia bacterium]|nr:arginine repressor [Thermoanaerobaculia bacterium]